MASDFAHSDWSELVFSTCIGSQSQVDLEVMKTNSEKN